MQPVANTDLTNPPATIVPLAKTSLKSGLFSYTVEPFINALAFTGRGIFLTAWHVADFTCKTVAAIYVVFYRLIVSPAFNPYDKAFKSSLTHFETQAPILMGQIKQLDEKFNQPSLIMQNMKDLERLNKEVFNVQSKLQTYLKILKTREGLFRVEKEIQKVFDRYDHLSEELNFFYKEHGSKVLNQFLSVLEKLTQGGIKMPKKIREDMILTWKSLESAMQNHIPNLKKSVRQLFKNLKKRMHKIETNQPTEIQPLKLKNIDNSCYMASVIQALLSIDSIRKELKRPISPVPDKKEYEGATPEYQKIYLEEYPAKFAHRVAIQSELLKLVKMQKMNAGNECNDKGSDGFDEIQLGLKYLLSFFDKEDPLHRLRRKIMKSGFHFDFNMNALKEQHDAAGLLLLLINYLLPNCKFKMQKSYSVEACPGIEFHGTVDLATSLQLNLLKPTNGDEIQTLENLIKQVIGQHVNDSEITINPKDGFIENTDQKAPDNETEPFDVNEFIEWNSFKELPEVFTIHIQRFVGNTVDQQTKLKDPLLLPVNKGILDLSDYYNPSEGAPKGAKFKLKGYIEHIGESINGGHYVSYVEIDGKYYLCNDANIKEISEDEFYGNVKAYLIFFERIPE